jgi:hypothetical protein
MTVKPPEHNAKSADTTKTRHFALLCAFLHIKASGAFSTRPGRRGASKSRTQGAWRAVHASDRGRRVTSLIVVLAVLLVPSAANASFTRKFERPIYRSEGSGGHLFTEPCTAAEAHAPGSPCLNPGGVAVNPEGVSSENDLRVGSLGVKCEKTEENASLCENPGGVEVPPEQSLEEFEPAAAGNTPFLSGSFKIRPCVEDKEKGEWEESSCLTATTKKGAKGEPEGNFEKPIPPESVAVERTLPGNGYIYVAGRGNIEVYENDGEHIETWGGFTKPFDEPKQFEETRVAIDNSPESLEDPAGCVLAECTVYVATRGGEGVPSRLEKFNSKGVKVAFSAGAEQLSYVHGDEITGSPEGCQSVFSEAQETLAAVTVDPKGDIYVAVGTNCKGVLEYEPSGKYLRDFDLESPELPGLGANRRVKGQPEGVAYDPVSRHLLVTVDTGEGVGAVDEFEAETGQFVAQISSAGAGGLEHPEAVAVDTKGDVYVADKFVERYTENGEDRSRIKESLVDVWGPGAYHPTVVLGQASARTSTTAVLNGSVNPGQHGNSTPAPVTACYFQYVEEAVYDEALAKKEEGGFPKANAKVMQAPCVQPDAAEILPLEPEAAHPVKAEIKGLQPRVVYRYRLVASTEEADNGGITVGEEVRAFTAPAPPEILSTSAQNISSTFADLHAQINPLGAATSYRFEYDTRPYAEGEGSHGTSVPIPDEGIGAGGPTGSSAASVLAHIGPLTPGTTYYFRVVAKNEVGPAKETAESRGAFTTQSTPVSSERAYELVTPATKEGGSDMFAKFETNGEFQNSDVGTPAESGEGFLLHTDSSFGGFPFGFGAYDVFNRVKSSRTGELEWSYTSLASPSLGVQTPNGQTPLVDPFDLSKVALDDAIGSLSGEQGSRTTDLLGAPGGPYLKLHEDPAVHTTAEKIANPSTEPVGGSRDLGNVVLESGYTDLCPGSEQVKHGNVLCEFSGGYETLEDGEVGPELKLVNLAPGSESEPASRCGASLGSLDPKGDSKDAVSSDGSRVFFTAPVSLNQNPERQKLEGKEGCWNEDEEYAGKPPKNAPQLYMRAGGQTIKVSAPEAGVTVGAGEQYPASYAGASEDGSRVFFATKTELTENDKGIHDLELYEYDTGSGSRPPTLTRVSAGESGHEAAEVVTVYAVAAQGTAVYFTADGVLAGNEGPDGSHASPGTCHENGSGGCNLYSYVPATAKISFVARVNENDVSHTGSGTGLLPSNEDLRAYATPDGRYLLFDTREDLTGYSTEGCIANSEQCMELYRYDVTAAERGEAAVVCVSCDPNGAPPVSNAFFERSQGGSGGYTPVRAMSDNGEYVFFDSADPLVSQATNDTLDTYEWHDGRISLIGSGTSSAPTFFLGYSPYYLPDGEKVEAGNVFIGTHAKLSPVQTNSVGNIYDARVCEPESPCIAPPSGETAQCEGGSCQTPPAAPPDPVATLLAPPSAATLTGPPPATKVTKKTTPKCRQGYVRKKVKKKETCVKKPKKSAHKSAKGRK